MVEFICYNWMSTAAHHVLDISKEQYNTAGVTPLHNKKNFNPYEVRDEDIIFVKTDFIVDGTFTQHYLDKIFCTFNIITGISSYNIGRDGDDSYLKILQHPGLNKWFCTNPPNIKNSKIIPLPIGFEEPDRTGGNQKVLKNIFNNRMPWCKKKDKVLMPYHDMTTNIERKYLFSHLKQLPFIDFQEEKLPFQDYLELLDQYKFVICLEGHGPDVHRNYEAMLVGAIPINKKNIIEHVFGYHSAKGVFLDSWGDLNEQFFKSLCSSHFDIQKNDEFIKLEKFYSLIKELT